MKQNKKSIFRRISVSILIVSFLCSCVAETGIGAIKVQAAEKIEERKKISLGLYHSAAIKEDGSLWMWGSNRFGELGNGSTENSANPIKIMDDVVSVELGEYNSAAIKEDGSLWMWGYNEYGQLGDGSTENRAEPIRILYDVSKVVLNGTCCAVIKKDGSLWMWGSNFYGQLGDGSTEDKWQPIKVMDNVLDVVLGSGYSAVVKKDGSLWMWGYNFYGQLGDGSTGDKWQPIKVMDNVLDIALGSGHSAAVKKDGSLWMWGNNGYSQLGNDYGGNQAYPIQIMENVTKVAVNTNFSAAVKEDGSLWMWGQNFYGQLGNGNTYNKSIPEWIMGDVYDVTLGDYHSAAIKEDGSLWTWGCNYCGALGNGSTYNRERPEQIMPAGSIDVSDGGSIEDGSGEDFTGTFPIYINSTTNPRIKVIDSDGKPISGASVIHQGITFTTGENGTVDLINYKWGELLEIHKEGYVSREIQNFTHSATGCSTYRLNLTDSPILGVTMEVNGKKLDLLKEEANINRYYKTTKFSIECEGGQGAFSFELYSDDKKIASSSDGKFSDLKYSSFEEGKDVILKTYSMMGKVLERRTLPIEVINLNPDKIKFSLGEKFTIEVPNGTPILGGEKLEISLGDLPVTCEVELDGKMKIGINATELVKKDKDWFSTLKKIGSAQNGDFSFLNKKKKKDPFEVSAIGYLESNVLHSDSMKGKLIIEISAKKASEKQIVALGVPIVIEVSISGKVNGDGSITYKIEEGFSGKVSAKGEIGAGLYGGIGAAKVASVGVYGEAGIGVKYDFLPEEIRGFNELYVKGQAGVKVKLFGKNLGKMVIIDGKYYIINNDTSRAFLTQVTAPELMKLSIDNRMVYQDFSRAYLNSNGGEELQWDSSGQFYSDGNVREANLQESTYLDIVPNVIQTDNGAMLFYLTDGGAERSSADRSQLVYSVYDEVNAKWSEPQAVLDDGTADFSPDFYAYNDKIYIVWQNAENSLEGELNLNEIADCLTLQVAVYDELTGSITDFGLIQNENNLFQQRPQIAAENGNVFVYWYENSVDNVLGLSGKNTLYQAVITETDVMQNMEVIGVMTDSKLDVEDKDTLLEADEENMTMSVNDMKEKSEEEKESEESSNEEKTEMEELKPEVETEELEIESELEESKPEVETEEPKNELETESELEEPKTEVGTEKEVEETNSSELEVTENTVSVNSLYAGLEERDILILENDSVSDNDVQEDMADEKQEEIEDTVSDNQLEIELAELETTNKFAESRILQEAKWQISFLGEEEQCISSADAGIVDGEMAYTYSAGKLDDSFEVIEGRIVVYTQDEGFITLENGKPEHVEIGNVFSKNTLSWYQEGDIHYMNERGKINSFFNESRLSSSLYTMITDASGIPEIIYPISMDGRSNLYRIAYENGEFISALEITNQDKYIQYVDGFIHGNDTIFVYNQMEINGNLEEVNNSLCTGILRHSYEDLMLVSAGSMVKTLETGEKVIDISAQVYNNGTLKAEELNLQLAKTDGTVLENVVLDNVLEAGEETYITAEFDLDNITEEADYFVSIVNNRDNNTENNSVSIRLGQASLQMAAEVIAVGASRTLQVGIENNGITSCGGTIQVYDAQNGAEYANSSFDAIARGEMNFVEVPITQTIFADRENLALEIIVTSETSEEVLSEQLVVYAPTYTVNFVTDEGEQQVNVAYGETVDFPENPVKEGARFKGWYTAENSEAGSRYTEETPITESVTLYACFIDKNESVSMEQCSVSSIPTQLYTGKALKPSVTVKLGGMVLEPEKDYTVSYTDNVQQGEATVTIIGKGQYTGSISRKFDILYSMNEVSVKAIPAVDFNGENHTPSVEVTYLQKKLTKDEDYTVTYNNNRNAGTAAVIITGKGKYSGRKTVFFDIEGIDISEMKFDKLKDVVYNGESAEAIVTVKTKDGKQLQAGADYKLVYENSSNKGTASVTVIGNGNYVGSKKMNYKIQAKSLQAEMIESIPDITYTGEAIKPEFTVTDNEKQLISGKDYKVSYSKNKNVGTATVTVMGKGNYKGSVKIPFSIRKESFENNSSVKVKVNDAAYTGRAIKPAVQVYIGERKLTSKDYTVSYSNNKDIGVADVIISGKGNYEGNIYTSFRIVEKKKMISALKIVKLKECPYTGDAVEPEIVIMDGSYRLVEGNDFEVIYENQYDAGKASASITGKGDYAGSKSVMYRISPKNIAKNNSWINDIIMEEIKEQKYSGNVIRPNVVLKDGEQLLQLGKDYILSYKKNINPGTAEITVTGKGNYKGRVSNITFSIGEWDYDNLQVEIEEQVYTGKELKPQVVFSIDGENIALKSGKTVKISYSNNKGVGEAKVKIVGSGKLAKMTPIEATFNIQPADIQNAVVNRIPNQTLKGIAVTPIPKVKVGKNTLKAGTDFEVSYLRNRVKGEAEIIITGIGNYCGEYRKSFIIQ